jgi:hypothetical protein
MPTLVAGGNQVFTDGHGEWVTTYPKTLIAGPGREQQHVRHTAGKTTLLAIESYWW